MSQPTPTPSAKLSRFVFTHLNRQLKNDPKALLTISMKARVPQPWLTLFAKGQIPNPGIDRIEKLYEYLSGKKINV